MKLPEIKGLKDIEYYSNCCGAFMFHWTDIDICPECGEHCGGLTKEEMEKES